MELSYGPVIPPPKFTQIMKKLSQKDVCISMFTVALFIIAKLWKQHKCPSVGEWAKKMWYVYTMEYYSAIKKKEILPFSTAWMELESIMLSQISQSEKDT